MAKQPQSCAFRTSIGGQALIEGILMRGPEKQAIVVRDQEGNLVEKVDELRLIKDRHPILGWPLIRGTVNFLSSMVNGVKALMYSADFYPEEETTEPSKFEQWLDRTFSNKKLEGLIVGLSVLLGIGLSIFLFLVLPTFLTGGLLHFFPDFPMWGRNLIEGVLKVAIFLLYLIFCSKQKDIYRVLQLRGGVQSPIPGQLLPALVSAEANQLPGLQRGLLDPCPPQLLADIQIQIVVCRRHNTPHYQKFTIRLSLFHWARPAPGTGWRTQSWSRPAHWW